MTAFWQVKWPSDISFKQKSRQIVSGNGLSKNNKWVAQKPENGGAFTPCRMNEKCKLGGNELFLYFTDDLPKCIADHSSVSCTAVSFRRKTLRDLCGVPIHEHMTLMNWFFLLINDSTKDSETHLLKSV